MFLSHLSVKRPVFTTMLVLAFVVLGVFAYLKLAVELTPNVEFPVVTVTTIYPGAGPEEIESQVTTKIEDAVSTLANIDLLESISRESVSFVIVRFELEVDANDAANDVRAKVDAILHELPSGIEKPKVVKFELGARPIISLAVSSDRSVNETYAVADKIIRDRLVQLPGVANVEIIGGQKREIQVAVDRRKLDYYGLTVSAVTSAIASENLNMPEGRITGTDREYLVRTMAEFSSIEEIEDLQIPLPAGGFVPLREVAEVRDTYEEARSRARFNGKPAVQIDIVKQSGANTIKTANAVYKAIERLRKELPDDFVIEIANDDSVFIRDSVRDVQQNILIGILLTAVLLYIFLRSMRGTFIAAVVMPAAIVSTFLLIQASGFTLNILTLMALGISVGILVTNSIVVLENIVRHLERGEDPRQAAILGTDEIALAVLASVMTNIVVFVPIAFMSGIVGRFFLQFGMTVVFATIFSLIISFTLTPMLSSVILKRIGGATRNNRPGGETKRKRPGLMERLAGTYRSVLAWGLERARNRWLLVGGTTVLLIFGIALLRLSGAEFVPKIDQGIVLVGVDLPAGTPLEVTESTVAEIEGILKGLPEVRSILSTIGGANLGVHQATIRAKLIDRAKRSKTAYELANELRPMLAGIPAADISVSASLRESQSSADLEIDVLGDDIGELRRISDQLKEITASVTGLVDVETSWEEGATELVFVPDRDELARRGLSTGAVAMLLRNAYEGDDRSIFREAGEEYAIRVQLRDQDRQQVESLESLRLALGPTPIPLSQLGHLERRRADAEILHRERQKRITVRANIAHGTLGGAVDAIRRRLDEIDLPPGYRIKFAGDYEFQQESFTSIFQALILAIILTYVVLAMILESFVHPVTVMLTLPLGLIGAALGLFFSGQTVNVLSLMAVVMLVGIVVNNAILLLDYVSQLRRRGMPLKEAILEACPVRLRPIVMTNLAIAVGMIPQVMSGAGAEYRVAMAAVTMGGVLVSALFTLVLIPSLYFAFERLIRRAE